MNLFLLIFSLFVTSILAAPQAPKRPAPAPGGRAVAWFVSAKGDDFVKDVRLGYGKWERNVLTSMCAPITSSF